MLSVRTGSFYSLDQKRSDNLRSFCRSSEIPLSTI